MANIPGANDVLPGVYSDIITQSRGVAIPGGSRIAAIIGEGSTDEVLVSQASGGGNDGLNPGYTSTVGSDGRHFKLSLFPVVPNRVTLFKNGIPLVGLESVIDGTSFSRKFDYKINTNTGEIELQTGAIVDQGGSFFLPLSSNVGDGYLQGLILVDANAQPETWTIRCVSVQRNNLNEPIPNTAKFLAFGSLSGPVLDANANPIVWSIGTEVTNSIIRFSIYENPLLPFREGDGFSLRIASGVLVTNDTLVANYIPLTYLNDPVLNLGLGDVTARHGFPSATNNLSLGCQLAFANQAPAVITVQAAPSVPRRRSFVLSESVNANSNEDSSFIFALPPGVTPDFNSNIHFFITNNSTKSESQILPNKFEYYSLNQAGNPSVSQFIFDTLQAPAGNSFFYSVIRDEAAIASQLDGVLLRDNFDSATFNASSTNFDTTFLNQKLRIVDSVNRGNNGDYTITDVSGGNLVVTKDDVVDFESESTVTFELILIATGLPVAAGTDGDLVALLSTGTAEFTSAGDVDFDDFVDLENNYRLRINGSNDNNGLYDITNYNAGQLTLQMSVVSESGLRFKIIDVNDVSNFIVINRDVVPNGFGLRVTLIDEKEASFYDAGWVNALDALETIECDIVVPLPQQTYSVIFQNTLAHCRAMSNIRNRKERVMLTGAIRGLRPENLTGAVPAAVENIGILEGIQGESITDILSGNVEDLANYSVPNAFGNTFRCIYFYPDEIVMQVGRDNALVDGFYIAAAAAGNLSADTRLENPLTNKVLTGFSILRNKQLKQLTKTQLAAAGVCVLSPVAGGGSIIWGVTTSQSGFAEEREASIVFIRDRVAKSLRAGFKPYIGIPETPELQTVLNTRAVILLGALQSQGLITSYADLSVKRDAADPTQWNITVRVQPTYPVNFIYIKVALGQI